MMLRYLIEKEFKQLKRNSFLPRRILLFPCMMMLVMPWAATLEIENLRIAVIDNDRSPSSERLVHRIEASRYFQLTALPPSYAQGLQAIEKDQADMLLEIPRGFEKAQANGQSPAALIAVNTVNGTKGGLGSAYLQQILNPSSSQDSVRYRFNPYLNYKVFMVPALMTMILVLLCGFLPALNVVSEKEAGTIEQINVPPVSKYTIILAKLIPYWVTGMLILTISIILAWLVYGLVPAGHLWLLYFFALLFIIVISGMGLVVSNYSRTMQQAMFVMFFFVIIIMLMSGLFTPINSMPEWAQDITIDNPLKYFIQVTRMVYLKGSGFDDLIMQFIALLFMAIMLNGWAVFSYKKNS